MYRQGFVTEIYIKVFPVTIIIELILCFPDTPISYKISKNKSKKKKKKKKTYNI